MNFVLRFRWLTLIAALLVLVATIYPLLETRQGIHAAAQRRRHSLHAHRRARHVDRRGDARSCKSRTGCCAKVPEVERVFGKAGQAETPTDPAPLSMFETVVTLKPPEQWRPGMTWEKLIAEMNAKIKTPGMANIFWMPIQTRTEMLTTGFRSILGIKVFGPDLGHDRERRASQIEKALSDFPEHAQRLRRAHDRRLLPRFHVEPRSRRPLRPDASAT